ncbi:hypothetical protein GOODEAATRI_011374 [Goodea atripinnis]|uniref:Uncharacterized protein n=1 Tax=Goodea atripinnis TaxID=208336 RepID=A0ABV0N0H4_9TELE
MQPGPGTSPRARNKLQCCVTSKATVGTKITVQSKDFRATVQPHLSQKAQWVWANVAKCLNCVIAMVDKLLEDDNSKQEPAPEQQLADVITSHNPDLPMRSCCIYSCRPDVHAAVFQCLCDKTYLLNFQLLRSCLGFFLLKSSIFGLFLLVTAAMVLKFLNEFPESSGLYEVGNVVEQRRGQPSDPGCGLKLEILSRALKFSSCYPNVLVRLNEERMLRRVIGAERAGWEDLEGNETCCRQLWSG